MNGADLQAHWELIQRGIYRRDNCLVLYYEVERLSKEVEELKLKLKETEDAKAQ